MLNGKKSQFDVNNQSLEQMYMDNPEKLKMEHVVCNNTYTTASSFESSYLSFESNLCSNLGSENPE